MMRMTIYNDTTLDQDRPEEDAIVLLCRGDEILEEQTAYSGESPRPVYVDLDGGQHIVIRRKVGERLMVPGDLGVA